MPTSVNGEKPVICAWLESELPQPGEQALVRLLSQFIDCDELIIWSAQPDESSIKELEAGKSNAWWAPVFVGLSILGYIAYSICSHINIYMTDPGNLINFWMPLVIGFVTLGIGVFSLVAPTRARMRAQYTLYAITNKRAIIFEPAQIAGRKKPVMHWKFTAIARSALRDAKSQRIAGRSDLQDVVFTYQQPLRKDQLGVERRGEVAVETTERGCFFGVPVDKDVTELLNNLRSGSN